jgi:RecA/RadA recombinase
LLDLVVGGGKGVMGLKGGKITRMIAVEGGGKSSVAVETVAQNMQKAGSTVWHKYLDREYRYAFDAKGVYGIDLDVLGIDKCPDTVEELTAFLDTEIPKHKTTPGIVIIDSLEAFPIQEHNDRAETRAKQFEAGKDIELKGSYTAKSGAPAHYAEALRVSLAHAERQGTLILALSQVRANLDAGMYGAKFKKIGGKALDHFVDTELWLKPLHYIEVGDKKSQTSRCIGFVGKAWEEKGTKDRPYRECLYTFLYGYGLDNTGDMVDYLYDLRNPQSGKFWNGARGGDAQDQAESPHLLEWGEGEAKTLESAGAWLTEIGRIEDARKAAKDAKKQIRLAWLDEWIAEDAELQAAYKAKFPVFTRTELILHIEETEGALAELNAKVIEKWESIEESASAAVSARKRKFA